VDQAGWRRAESRSQSRRIHQRRDDDLLLSVQPDRVAEAVDRESVRVHFHDESQGLLHSALRIARPDDAELPGVGRAEFPFRSSGVSRGKDFDHAIGGRPEESIGCEIPAVAASVLVDCVGRWIDRRVDPASRGRGAGRSTQVRGVVRVSGRSLFRDAQSAVPEEAGEIAFPLLTPLTVERKARRESRRPRRGRPPCTTAAR